ncbi:MAG: TetR family transcriptional regulator [Actinomycetota bacterium]|nr:TetR/AcrR family transcriptional regulator [Actinomycetota bacterium]
MLHDQAPGVDEQTRSRILDAGFSCAGRFGVGRTTMSDVAREAGLSRQTLYRYFASKHDLIAALVMREDERLIEKVRVAAEPYEDLRPALEAAFLTCLQFFRNHPLLTRVMASEPHELLPFLTVEGNPVIDLGTRTMEEVLAQRLPNTSRFLIHRAAETCARVLTSYAITPPVDSIEEVAASTADLFSHGLSKEAR